MPVPGVAVTKNPYALPGIPPSAVGILAIVASSQSNVPGALVPVIYSNPTTLQSDHGPAGPLVEYGAYVMTPASNQTVNPIVAMNPTSSVAATYTAFTVTGVTGTAVPSAGATPPLEHYAVIVNIINGGALGTTGITYQISFDNGGTFSATTALGTVLNVSFANTGINIIFGTSTTTYVAGDTFSFFTERALMANADMTAAAAALILSRLPFEGVYFDTNFGSASASTLDTILAGWEANGQFRFGALNSAFKTEPLPTGQTEAAYATALTTAMGSQVSQRVMVGADGGHVPSGLTGYNLKRPTALLTCSRAMGLTPNIGIDPAYVGTGPLQGVTIAGLNFQPFDHDEALYPNLDGLGYTALRSFAPGGPAGTYVNNANVISGGSNIAYLQQLRVLNIACGIAWSILSGQLSLGVRTQLNVNTNQLNIATIDKLKIEGLVNPTLQSSLKGQVTGVLFTLNADDNLGVTPVSVGGQVSVVGFAYIKNFKIVVAFAKSIAVANG